MWRINTQVHQTMNDTPYHLTYGQHPRVGISNLPVSAAILQNLSTEAELQDLYSTMNVDGVALPAPLSTTDGSYRKDLPPDDAGLDDVMLEIAIATADKLVPQTPLGKRKETAPRFYMAITIWKRGLYIPWKSPFPYGNPRFHIGS